MTTIHHTVFPVLDAPRLYATNLLHRTVKDDFGYLEPYMSETDSWFALPLRLVHDDAGSWHLELGPYSLNGTDVERLRETIAAYDRTTVE
ncbi:hypothetical protein [Mycobacterium europaeum]|uniref:hypothetical protein n=1 Tax=Mycobacterium europaeum TaxID=761804 RepID=UPI0011501004|nr:hypothetical protein [Mycobacterium europaeum]